MGRNGAGVPASVGPHSNRGVSQCRRKWNLGEIGCAPTASLMGKLEVARWRVARRRYRWDHSSNLSHALPADVAGTMIFADLRSAALHIRRGSREEPLWRGRKLNWRRFRRKPLAGPISTLEGDREFMNYLAAYEGQLPDSFFSFDRKSLDFQAAFAAGATLRKRTQDLRLSLLAAKLSVLNRDFYGFAREVAEVAWLLTNRWDDVHPQGERGDFSSRLAQLGTLDDSPVVVLPLQYATLAEFRARGPAILSRDHDHARRRQAARGREAAQRRRDRASAHHHRHRAAGERVRRPHAPARRSRRHRRRHRRARRRRTRRDVQRPAGAGRQNAGVRARRPGAARSEPRPGARVGDARADRRGARPAPQGSHRSPTSTPRWPPRSATFTPGSRRAPPCC